MKPEKIKALRKRLCLSQVKLAIAVGVTPQAVQNWEQGKCGIRLKHRVSLEQLEKKRN